MRNGHQIFFVDDDPQICELVAGVVRRHNWHITCFANAEDCLGRLKDRSCDLLITDLRLPGMDGIELLEEAKKTAPWVRVVLVTGFGDIQTAVKVMKLGADDFLEKPLRTKMLVSSIKSVFNGNHGNDPLRGNPLSVAEQRVLNLLLRGMNNAEIAAALSRSRGTIEVHRKHIMRKLGAKNAVELGVKAAAAGYGPNQ